MADIKCTECDGKGYHQWTDCGVDVANRLLEENDLCPMCKEHQGDIEKEMCKDCRGTGIKQTTDFENALTINKMINNLASKFRTIY